MANNKDDFTKQLLKSLRGRNQKNAIHYLLEQACLFFRCDAATIYLLDSSSNQTVHPFKEFVRNSDMYPLSYIRRDTLLNLSSKDPVKIDAFAYGDKAESYGMLLHDDEDQPLGALVLVHHQPFELNQTETLRTVSSYLSMYVTHLQSSKTDWNSLSYIEERIRRQQSDFMRLMKDSRLTTTDLIPAFQLICESTVETLQIDRVGIWFYKNEKARLECQAMYDRSNPNSKRDTILKKCNYPTYFASLEENRSIVVEDTTNDFRVRELEEDYLTDHNIKALMDIPIISGGITIGVLCCEQHAEPRAWTFDEEGFATSIGDMIAFINEHIKRRKAEKEVKDLAYSDHLTNLPNRNALEERLDYRIERADGEHYFALVYFDIDNFSEINMRLGYRVGDQLLMAVTRKLRSALRKNELLTKMDYDGFIIMTDMAENKSTLHRRIQTFQDLLNHSFDVNNQEFYITVSKGIVIFPEDGDSPATMIRNAHRANSESKRLGRGRMAFYHSSLDEAEMEHQWFQMNIAKALEHQEFRLYYQPQVDTSTNQVTGVEALIRWEHPQKGLVPPNSFIPLAELTGLIIPLGQWTIRKAAEEIHHLNELGYNNLTVSVNISAIEFQQTAFVHQLQKIINETNLSAERLRLEITETIATEQEDYMIEQLHRLNELGVTVALDDFGTGYSSLKYLSLFPIQCVKIDRSFIHDVTTNSKNEAIVRSIVDLADHLKLSVITEGVETEQDLQHVKSLGSHTVQGFYFSKPLTSHQLETWLNEFYSS